MFLILCACGRQNRKWVMEETKYGGISFYENDKS